MRRARTSTAIAVATACGLAVAASGPAAAASGSPATTAPPSASLTRIACRSSLQPALNRVSVVSVMRHLPGTRSLAVRVRLTERQPGEPAQVVGGGDLGRWVTPAIRSLGQRTGDVWRLAKVVSDVDAPASYRFTVDFRWEGSDDRVIARRTLQTRSCTVRQLRPDVLVRGVTVTTVGTRAPHDRYVAEIANRGASASGPFSVLFAPGGGAPSQTVAIASLAPRSHRRVTFQGPVCDAADPPTVVADPSDQVDDYDRANNTFTVVCPAS